MSIYKRTVGVVTPRTTRHATTEELGQLLARHLIQPDDFVVGFDGHSLRFVVCDPEGVFYYVTQEALDQ